MSLRSRLERLENHLHARPTAPADTHGNTADWLAVLAELLPDAPYAMANLSPAQLLIGQSELRALAGEVRAGKVVGQHVDVLELLSDDVLRCLESLLILAGQSSPAPSAVPPDDPGLLEAAAAAEKAWGAVAGDESGG